MLFCQARSVSLWTRVQDFVLPLWALEADLKCLVGERMVSR